MMSILSILLIGGGLLTWFFQSSYLGELSISFLPYWSVGFLIALLIAVRRLAILLYKKPEKVGLFTRYAAFWVVAFGAMFVLFTGRFWNFYKKVQLASDLQQPLKIFYANIYKDNSEYASLLEQIEAENPDVILFVEYSPHHQQGLGVPLLQKYPHRIKAQDSTSFIASKYPVERIPTSLDQQKWKYYHFFLEKSDHKYHIALVHTSSPTSHQHFLNRNAQLEKLAEELLEFQDQHPESKTLIVGDFNISPRSNYYQLLAKKRDKKLINATQSFPIYFSWNLAKLFEISGALEGVPPLLWSHIDQVFFSPNLQLAKLKSLDIKGSDHRGFSLEIE